MSNARKALKRLGFGSYRIDQDSTDSSLHRQAFMRALRSGVPLIDTSTNYGDGGSERLIGEVLAASSPSALPSDLLSDLVLVTKVGYLQGETLAREQDLRAQNRGHDEVVEYSPGCWHCIHPSFLSDQIDRSRERLRLTNHASLRAPVLLLHNPEYFLQAGGDSPTYYARIEKAFRYLETEIDRGRIDSYGVSSNTLGHSKDAPAFTSLEVLLDLSHKISRDLGRPSGFRMLQMPFNLYEPGGWLEDHSPLNRAKNAGLQTLINRPLNAFTEHFMIRLADFEVPPVADVEASARLLKDAFEACIQLEAKLPKKPSQPRLLAWGHILREHAPKLPDVFSWREALQHQIIPGRDLGLEQMGASEWSTHYRNATDHLFRALTRQLTLPHYEYSKKLSRALDAACPALSEFKSLSQKALALYWALPQIDTVLVGMRRPEYVDDVLEAARIWDSGAEIKLTDASLRNAFEAAERALLK